MGITFNPFTGQLDITGTGSGGGGGTASRYTQVFNATTDWGSPSGGYYTITIPVATHGKGLHPNIMTFELNGSDYEMVNVDLVKVNASGDVSIRVLQSPNTRFAGLVLII